MPDGRTIESRKQIPFGQQEMPGGITHRGPIPYDWAKKHKATGPDDPWHYMKSRTGEHVTMYPGYKPSDKRQTGDILKTGKSYVENYFENPMGPQAQPGSADNAAFYPSGQLYPLAGHNIRDPIDWKNERLSQYAQLIPTSENLRNYTLQQTMNEYNRPYEQLYAAQNMGQVVGQRAGNLDMLRSEMAQRGLTNSGIADERGLNTEMQYLQGVTAAQQQARIQENQRKNLLLREMSAVPERDMQFYNAIRSGTIPAASLWNINAKDWGQVAYGLGTAARQAISAAAGAGAGVGAQTGMSMGTQMQQQQMANSPYSGTYGGEGGMSAYGAGGGGMGWGGGMSMAGGGMFGG